MYGQMCIMWTKNCWMNGFEQNDIGRNVIGRNVFGRIVLHPALSPIPPLFLRTH